MASASAEVAGRNRSTAAHTGVPAQISHAVLLPSKPIKRQAETSLGLPCENRQCHQWRILLPVEQLSQHSSCNSSSAILTYECSTSRSSKFCTSGERGTWLELPLQGSQVSKFLLIKLASGSRGKVPNTHCEGEKPPLRLRLFLVLTASAIAIFVVKTLDSVLSTYPFQHCLEQSSVSLDSSDLLGALHPCLADLDSMLGKRTCKNTAVVDATITTQGLWPTSPTDPQADEAIQALSAGRRNVSLSQQYYLLKSST